MYLSEKISAIICLIALTYLAFDGKYVRADCSDSYIQDRIDDSVDAGTYQVVLIDDTFRIKCPIYLPPDINVSFTGAGEGRTVILFEGDNWFVSDNPDLSGYFLTIDNIDIKHSNNGKEQ